MSTSQGTQGSVEETKQDNASEIVWVDRGGIFAGFEEEVTLDQELGN